MYTKAILYALYRDMRTGTTFEVRDISSDGTKAGVRDIKTRDWGIRPTNRLVRIKHHRLTFEESTGFRSQPSLDWETRGTWFPTTTNTDDNEDNEDEEDR